MTVHPVTLEVARLAGRIHGEQMGRGIGIDFPDLIIGATALHLGFDVVTLNVRHFQVIPGRGGVRFQREDLLPALSLARKATTADPAGIGLMARGATGFSPLHSLFRMGQ